MGNNLCGEDIFKKLLTEYGDDFMKLILAEKSKDIVRDKFLDLNNESDNRFGDFQGRVNAVVDQKLQSLDQSFEGAKASVQKYLPGGISTLERMKGESINQFSGFNSLQSKIDGIRDQTLNTAENHKNKVMQDLQGKKNEMINTIQAERPKVPVYQSLPEPLRAQIMRKGQKQFGEQIAENKQSIIKRLLDNFLPDSFKFIGDFFNQMNPENPLSGIVQNAFGVMSGNITSASGGGGGASGIINNFKNIF